MTIERFVAKIKWLVAKIKKPCVIDFTDQYLGHGRMLESALIFVKFQYAAMFLIVPVNRILFNAFSDFEGVSSWVLAAPFMICAVIQSAGLALNIRGCGSSRWFRLVGASIGIAIWTFLLVKDFVLGYYATSLNPWLLMAIIGSVIIIRKAFLNLPIPGSTGAA